MLRSLYIQNYALIEKLDISFGAGFDFKRNLRRAHAGILFRCVWRGNDRK